MSLRMLSGLTLAVALAGALSCAALPQAVANTTFDPEGRFSGGRPASAKVRGLFEILQMQRQEVGFETKEKAGHGHYLHEGAQALSRSRFQPCAALRRRRRPRRLHLERHPQPSATRKNGRTGARRRKCSSASLICRKHMKGGPGNPLGARALYIGSTIYRIHGTHDPDSVGEADSSGCIRLNNDDIIDLYGRVQVGAKVIVVR